MSKQSWLRMAVLLCVAVALCAGCRRTRPQTGGVTPTDIGPGDIPMTSDRIEDGVRVDASEFQSENVLFDYDSFQIKGTEIAKIEKVGQFMKAEARVRLVAEGHCDERGSREYNMALGEQRAQAVRAHLVGLGIAPDRVQTKSYGKEKPINPGHSESAWRENRRVEATLYR